MRSPPDGFSHSLDALSSSLGIMKISHRNSSKYTPHSYRAMNDWFASTLGRHLLDAERAVVEQMLARRFGYHLLQLGCAELTLHDKSPMGHKFSFCAWPEAQTCHTAIASGEAIPLANSTVDLVLLHHALDYSEQQHQLLREAARVLIAGGHLVIVGFNPFSSWGIRSRLRKFSREPGAPWHAAMISPMRLTDWLKLLDFQVEQIRYDVYSLPVNAPRVIRYSGMMGSLAGRLNWPTGGIYAICARKQVLPLTPVQTHRRRLPVPALGLPITDKASKVARERLHVRQKDNVS